MATWKEQAYDRGVQKRLHPAGLEVYMFVDQPGVFFNAHGNEMDPSLAHEAGFPTEDLLKEKARRDRIADATARIDEEFSVEGKRDVVAEVNGYRIAKLGSRGHQIFDADDNLLTPGKFLSIDDAKRIAHKMKPIKAKKNEGAEAVE